MELLFIHLTDIHIQTKEEDILTTKLIQFVELLVFVTDQKILQCFCV